MDFSFIVAVRRHSKSQTFRQLARRIDLDSDSKLREALRRIAWITSMRVPS
ncbi:MAG TPA: 2-oxo-4-hydroxy-4-carboxy-5-ureidoimidazoline decarboxylase, partial [Variovorax sp.]|nr:2-oxo-4-hydroxy-4-carboxy-5-ureidoimidazoline decarboxylase [Variovorax sp.]